MSLKDAIREAVDERDKQSKTDLSASNMSGETQQETLAPPSKFTAEATRPIPIRPVAGGVGALEAQTRSKTASHKTVNTASSKAATPLPSEKATEDGSGDDSPEASVETAALTVRVPRSHRIHWLIGAKREGTSLTAAITEALNARFGEPRQ